MNFEAPSEARVREHTRFRAACYRLPLTQHAQAKLPMPVYTPGKPFLPKALVSSRRCCVRARKLFGGGGRLLAKGAEQGLRKPRLHTVLVEKVRTR